jgi:hypothetical protein
MTPRRRRPPKAISESQELQPTTDNLESAEESIHPFSTLADPDATTWQESPEPEITAPVKLPSQEAMTVQLGPVHFIERLEEYQSDENLGFTLIGLFIGAIIGVVINWATNEPFIVTPFSLILIGIFFIFAIGTGIWLRRTRIRRENIKRRLLE